MTYDGQYGWRNNFPKHTTGEQNGINNGYVYLYNSLYDGITSLQELGFAAMSSDAFVLGIAGLAHLTGYNVSYTDGHAAWYNDRDREIARETSSHGSNHPNNRLWWVHLSKDIRPNITLSEDVLD